MDFESARAAIYGRLDTYWTATHPSIPVQYENQKTVDLATQTEPFISCDVVYVDGAQIALADPPGTRWSGAVWLSSWVKEGGGTAGANAHMKEFSDLFGMKIFGGVNTKAGRRVPSNPHNGWYIQSIRVPLWFDDF
jgi:hypothetical protein